jgi:polysaccharide export outer membrane protein
MNVWMNLLVGSYLTFAYGQGQVAPSRADRKDTEQRVADARSSAGASVHAATTDPDYRIGPQDVITINVWKEPDISRVIPVRPDGKISIPLLNDVLAAGLTPMELANVITEGLKKYMNGPQVTVIITEINSRRVYVLGQVGRPGAFPLLPNMTVLQLLSSCGGFTEFANSKKIYILRTVGDKQVKIFFNYKDVVSGRKPGDNIALQTGDTLVVP